MFNICANKRESAVTWRNAILKITAWNDWWEYTHLCEQDEAVLMGGQLLMSYWKAIGSYLLLYTTHSQWVPPLLELSSVPVYPIKPDIFVLFCLFVWCYRELRTEQGVAFRWDSDFNWINPNADIPNRVFRVILEIWAARHQLIQSQGAVACGNAMCYEDLENKPGGDVSSKVESGVLFVVINVTLSIQWMLSICTRQTPLLQVAFNSCWKCGACDLRHEQVNDPVIIINTFGCKTFILHHMPFICPTQQSSCTSPSLHRTRANFNAYDPICLLSLLLCSRLSSLPGSLCESVLQLLQKLHGFGQWLIFNHNHMRK